MRIVTRISRKQWFASGVILALLGLASGLAVYQFGMSKPVATPTIIVRRVPELPTEPLAAAWRRVSAVVLPLAAVSTPNAPARQVSVQALTDGKQMAIRLEWQDTTRDVLTLRPQDFGDQAAMMLSAQLANACMGQVDVPVNIWQWKADWQSGTRDMAAAFPNMYTDGFTGDDGKPLLTEDLFTRPAFTVGNARAAAAKAVPVEHLVAGGFSTLTAANDNNPATGRGAYDEGKWAVVFTRPLDAGTPGDVALAAQAPLQSAFAVWDGHQMQRDGMKYVTAWAVLQLEAAPKQ
ncbi:MAG TPA: ethylbenzene dehydrogenase-related protein [Symbiobacteriaceae bacterium]|jgi:hypothetical protein